MNWLIVLTKAELEFALTELELSKNLQARQGSLQDIKSVVSVFAIPKLQSSL